MHCELTASVTITIRFAERMTLRVDSARLAAALIGEERTDDGLVWELRNDQVQPCSTTARHLKPVTVIANQRELHCAEYKSYVDRKRSAFMLEDT